MPRALRLSAAAVVILAACSSDATPSPSAGAEVAFPRLSAYRKSCTVDTDCALVPGEGCISCDTAALETSDAAAYEAAYAEAEKQPRCLSLRERAAPCASPSLAPKCQASSCVAMAVAIADGGSDAAH